MHEERSGESTSAAELSNTDAAERDAAEDVAEDEYAPSPFPHPEWTVGLVLVAGGITLLFGLLVNPIWLVVGSPFLIALFLWLFIKIFVRPQAS